MAKFELIGTRTDHEYCYGGYTGKKTTITEVVATFDSEELAQQYIKCALLKNSSRTPDRPFKLNSLLCEYEFGDIKEEYVEEIPPHNPPSY